jgi:hypothetical protein
MLAMVMIGATSTVEPMRWRLPLRYMFTPLDIHRSGFIDYTMCMRVALSPGEAERFVSGSFEEADRVARSVPMDKTRCPAAFWPRRFTEPTMAYAADDPSNPLQGARGAVYQDGYVYLWSNSM